MMFVGSAGLKKSLCFFFVLLLFLQLEGTAFTVGYCMISETTES